MNDGAARGGAHAPDFMTPREVCELLHMSMDALKHARRDGRLKAEKVDGHYRFSRHDVNAYARRRFYTRGPKHCLEISPDDQRYPADTVTPIETLRQAIAWQMEQASRLESDSSQYRNRSK